MATAASGINPSTFVPVLDLSKRKVGSTQPAPPAAVTGPVDAFSPQEANAIDKLPSRAELLTRFQKNPDAIAVTEDQYGKDKVKAYSSLHTSYLKTHSETDVKTMLAGVQKKIPAGGPQVTVAMARLMAQSLQTQDAMKLEADVAAAVVGGERSGGAKYDLTHPKPAPSLGAVAGLF